MTEFREIYKVHICKIEKEYFSWNIFGFRDTFCKVFLINFTNFSYRFPGCNFLASFLPSSGKISRRRWGNESRPRKTRFLRGSRTGESIVALILVGITLKLIISSLWNIYFFIWLMLASCTMKSFGMDITIVFMHVHYCTAKCFFLFGVEETFSFIACIENKLKWK